MTKTMVILMFLTGFLILPQAPATSTEQGEQETVSSLLNPAQSGPFAVRMEHFRAGFLRMLDRYAALRGHGGEFAKKERAIKIALLWIGTSMNVAIAGYNEGALSQDDLSTILMVQMARSQKLLQVHPELGP